MAKPDGAMGAALLSLQGRSIAGFLQTVVPASELTEARASWEEKRKEEITEEDEAEFQKMISMATRDGAEDVLFSMAQPHLKDVQQQLGMLPMMLPMIAGGALKEAGAPEEATAMLGEFATKLSTLDVVNEDKLRDAIGILVKSARLLEVQSLKEVQALDFDQILSRSDVLYGGVVDILGVYGLSPQETIDSMKCKVVSTEGDVAQMEMTFSLFGAEPKTVPFEMEKLDGRWFPKKLEAPEAVEAGETVEAGADDTAR